MARVAWTRRSPSPFPEPQTPIFAHTERVARSQVSPLLETPRAQLGGLLLLSQVFLAAPGNEVLHLENRAWSF
jgi:hypothetical protein